MSDNLSKNNNPKLKWWHKGALVGFGIALATLIFREIVFFPMGAFIMLVVNLLVLPFFNFFIWLLEYFTKGVSVLMYFGEEGAFILALLVNFISWILGGIFYAWIFRLIRKHFRKEKNKKQSGFTLPTVILIAVILIVVGGAGYYLYKTSVDETADWEVYRNEYSYEKDYWGYEIKYPSDWTIIESKGVHQAKWVPPRTMISPLRDILIRTLGVSRHGGSVDTINCAWSESKKEWFKKYPELELKTYPRPIGKEKIGELEFCRLEDIGGDEVGKIGGLGIKYVISKNGWDYRNVLWVYYDISEDYQLSEDEFQYELDIFKKMLSTFKFIEK